MCGIFGFYGKYELDSLIKCSKLQNHRGPDNYNFYIAENIFLAHNRLSIIDLSENANQPMISKCERYILVFNGEIYNFIEIKKILLDKGYQFLSNSDTEVIINAYKEWGVKAFDLFNGDWIICILNKSENNFIIAKDRLGSKPLYLYEDSEYLSFCSEVKGFQALKPPEYDEKYLGLNYKSIYDFNGTKFKDIYQTM